MSATNAPIDAGGLGAPIGAGEAAPCPRRGRRGTPRAKARRATRPRSSSPWMSWLPPQRPRPRSKGRTRTPYTPSRAGRPPIRRPARPPLKQAVRTHYCPVRLPYSLNLRVIHRIQLAPLQLVWMPRLPSSLYVAAGRPHHSSRRGIPGAEGAGDARGRKVGVEGPGDGAWMAGRPCRRRRTRLPRTPRPCCRQAPPWRHLLRRTRCRLQGLFFQVHAPVAEPVAVRVPEIRHRPVDAEMIVHGDAVAAEVRRQLRLRGERARVAAAGRAVREVDRRVRARRKATVHRAALSAAASPSVNLPPGVKGSVPSANALNA